VLRHLLLKDPNVSLLLPNQVLSESYEDLIVLLSEIKVIQLITLVLIVAF